MVKKQCPSILELLPSALLALRWILNLQTIWQHWWTRTQGLWEGIVAGNWGVSSTWMLQDSRQKAAGINLMRVKEMRVKKMMKMKMQSHHLSLLQKLWRVQSSKLKIPRKKEKQLHFPLLSSNCEVSGDTSQASCRPQGQGESNSKCHSQGLQFPQKRATIILEWQEAEGPFGSGWNGERDNLRLHPQRKEMWQPRRGVSCYMTASWMWWNSWKVWVISHHKSGSMRYARKPGSMLDYSDHVGSLVSHLALVVLVIFWLQCMFMMLIVGDRGIIIMYTYTRLQWSSRNRFVIDWLMVHPNSQHSFSVDSWLSWENKVPGFSLLGEQVGNPPLPPGSGVKHSASPLKCIEPVVALCNWSTPASRSTWSAGTPLP